MADRLNLGNIFFNVSASTEGLDKATRSAKNFDKSVEQAGKSGKKFTKTLDSISSSAVLSFGPLSGVGSRIISLIRLMKSVNVVGTVFVLTLTGIGIAAFKALSEFSKGEQAALGFANSLKLAGNSSKFTTAQLNDLASTLAFETMNSLQGTREAISALLAFDLAPEFFERTLRVSQDLSAQLGTSLQEALKQVARAVQDPKKGLEETLRAVVNLTDADKALIESLAAQGRTTEASEMILRKLEGSVGGFAKALATGYAGALDTAGQANEEFFESIARFTFLGETATKVVNRFADVMKNLKPLAVIIGKVLTPIVDVIGNFLVSALEMAGKGLINFATIVKMLVDLGKVAIEGWGALGNLFRNTFPQDIKKSETAVKEFSIGSSSKIVGFIKGTLDIIRKVPAGIVSSFTLAGNFIANFFARLWEQIKSPSLTGLDDLRDITSVAFKDAAEAGVQAFNSTLEATDAIDKFIGDLPTAFVKKFKESRAELTKALQDSFDKDPGSTIINVSKGTDAGIQYSREFLNGFDSNKNEFTQRISGILSESITSLGSNLSDHLANKIMGEDTSFKDIAKSFTSRLFSALIQEFAINPIVKTFQTTLSNLTTGVGVPGLPSIGAVGGGVLPTDAVGSLPGLNDPLGFLGGLFANGGTPPLNKPSLVGEKGPELFVPRSTGTVVPNHALGGGGTTINFTVNAQDAASFKNSRSKIVSDLRSAVR